MYTKKILLCSVILINIFLINNKLTADDDIDPAPEYEPPASIDQNLRMTGDAVINFGLGGFFPAYCHTFGFRDACGLGLFPGLSVFLSGEVYLTSHFRIGGALGFSTCKGMNESFAYFLPFTFRAIYEFRVYSFSFPVGGETGFLVGAYKKLNAINLIFKAKAGAFWHFNRQWALGIDAAYWLVPQVVWKELKKSRVGGLFEVNICGQYFF